MNICFIFVLYKTPKAEVERLRKEAKGFPTFFIDNTKSNSGYAVGVNKGLKKALKEKCDAYVVCNSDISIKTIKKKDIDELLKKFDIGGFAMKQNGKVYYGGEVDRWRMSGGLLARKPKNKYQEVDFVSGSFMAISKKTIETIGLFDESYGMYYEDVEYCARAKRAGLKIGVSAHVLYEHYESSSENTSKKYSLFINRLRFLWRYGSPAQKAYEFLRLPKTVWETIVRGL